MPIWFREEEEYYSTLLYCTAHWTWGIYEGSKSALDKDKLIFSKSADSPGPVCVLGSELFDEGIHVWEIEVSDVSVMWDLRMWVGISRGVEDKKDGLIQDPTVSPNPFCDSMLVFDERGELESSPSGKYCLEKHLSIGYGSGQNMWIPCR